MNLPARGDHRGGGVEQHHQHPQRRARTRCGRGSCHVAPSRSGAACRDHREPAIGWLTPTADFSIFGVGVAAHHGAGVHGGDGAGGGARGARPVHGVGSATARRCGARHCWTWGCSGPARSPWQPGAAMVAVGEFAIIFVLPLYLTNVLGLDIMQSRPGADQPWPSAHSSRARPPAPGRATSAPGTVLIGLGLEVLGVAVLALVVGPAPLRGSWPSAARRLRRGAGPRPPRS
ncbi:hypothetical protein QJS66_13125 [Kocuria rhizophila]|nr:hypothetical protein QJS66_13125 [Kocuria rhizophila]